MTWRLAGSRARRCGLMRAERGDSMGHPTSRGRCRGGPLPTGRGYRAALRLLYPSCRGASASQPMNPIPLLAAAAWLLPLGLGAQTTNRTNLLTTVPAVGGNLSLTVTHPATEAGNPFVIYWSLNYAGAVNLGLSYVQGLLRVDPATFGPLLNGTFTANT